MEFQASDSPAGGTPAVVVTVVFAADAVVEAVETVEEVVLPVVDPGPGIKGKKQLILIIDTKVINLGSDTFGKPIFQKGLQN